MPDHERRLTTIVAIDVAGYSRLMHADETSTLERMRAARAVTDPIGEAHHARIVGTWGDGLLVEFPSVVEATLFAREAQAAMTEFNAETPDDRKLLYRIGINLGDVIVEGGDLFGDGVNIAARLEALADAGGVVLSGAAHEQVRDKLDIPFADMGEIEVKNIARPVRAWRMLTGHQASVPPRPSRAGRRWVAPAAGLLLAILAGLLGWWQLGGWPQADPVIALPNGPKIVVLPFNNLSGDPKQAFFVDGLTEDLTTRLTDHGWLFVIARNSAFKYKGNSVDVREVGRDLAVDYVVEGSVQRIGDRIRVSAQVLKASDATHVWAQSFDRKLDASSVFRIQSELTVAISETIGGVRGAVAHDMLKQADGRNPKHMSSYQCVLMALRFWQTLEAAAHLKARDCLERAVKQEPGYARGWSELARLYAWEVQGDVNRRPDPLVRAENAINRALKIDPANSNALSNRAWLSLIMRRKDDVVSSTEAALKLTPNRPYTLHQAAIALMHVGQSDRAMAIWRKVSAIDPLGPSWSNWVPLQYHRIRKEYDQAYRYILKIKQNNSSWHWVPGFEASLLAHMGRGGEAREALARALKLNPKFAEVARAGLSVYWWSQPDQIEDVMNGLYKAGLPKPEAVSK